MPYLRSLGLRKSKVQLLGFTCYATRLWNFCSCGSFFNELLRKYQVLAVRWVRGPGIILLSKTSPRMTEAEPAIPHPLFGLRCTIYQSAIFVEHYMMLTADPRARWRYSVLQLTAPGVGCIPNMCKALGQPLEVGRWLTDPVFRNSPSSW